MNFRLMLLLFFPLISSSLFALEAPQGQVIMTVSGAIENTNAGDVAEFDEHMLSSLPQYHFTTHTPWTHTAHTYTGFSAKDLLELLKSKGTMLHITALNQYITDIPLSDFTDHGAIFAIYKDGQPISVRKLGPIMVLYPFDKHKELRNEPYYWRSIWQVNQVEVLVESKR